MRVLMLSVVGLSVLLWSAVGIAEDGNTPIECGTDATYNPFGYLWAPTPPAADNPVVLTFHVEAPSNTGGQTFTVLDGQLAVLAAFSTWESITCEGKEPNVPHFEIDGELHSELDRGDVWDGNDIISHKNVVFWDTTGSNPFLSEGTLAYTNVLYFGTAMSIDGDVMFNDADFSWRTTASGVEKGCVRGVEGCYDIQAVALHEAGHFLGFGHVECADAVMYPTGSGASSNYVLSSHEEAGLCAIYPPRESTTALTLGEACESVAECPTQSSCIQASTGGTLYGYCAGLCTSDEDCSTGFVCSSIALQDGGSLNFCAPGLGNVATDSEGNPIGDLCSACSSGEHCQSGLCLEEDGISVCSRPCNDLNECPLNFSCVAPTSGGAYCWPDDPSECGLDTRPGLNQVCYREGAAEDGGDLYDPCGPGLSCMGFRPLCQGRQGACVLYCDTATLCPDNLTCCFEIDENGHCMEASSDRNFGGCFDLRKEGEACVSAEQSVCFEGYECVAVGELSQAKCYETCDSGTCGGDEYCWSIAPLCEDMSQLNICCDNEYPDTCVPGELSSLKEVGEVCAINSECYSGLCLNYDDSSVCSRSCDVQTGVGCPDDTFDCLFVANEARCWPQGIVEPEPTDPPVPAPSGCCRALGHPLSSGDLFFSALVWLPFAFIWFRSRRRR